MAISLVGPTSGTWQITDFLSQFEKATMVGERVAKFARPVMVRLRLNKAGVPAAVPATPPRRVMRPP